MMARLFVILHRDLGLLLLGGRKGGTVLPLLFFLSVAMLFPFAVGPRCHPARPDRRRGDLGGRAARRDPAA